MNSSSPLNITESLLANVTNAPSPAPFSTLATPALPPPLPAIIITLCLFLLFAGCATFMAVCRPSAPSGCLEGGCGHSDPLPCSPALSSEPQLRLWKRLGSMRRSVTSSFRRPPPRRPDREGSAPSPAPPHIAVPCLFDQAVEI